MANKVVLLVTDGIRYGTALATFMVARAAKAATRAKRAVDEPKRSKRDL